MYEAPAKPRNQLAIRKSPSMPMLDIAIIGGDVDSASSTFKCPLSSSGLSSGRKTATPVHHRKLKPAVSLCVGILICTLVLFVLVALDPSKVVEEPWRGNNTRGGPWMRVALPSYRHWSNHALLLKSLDAETTRQGDGSDGLDSVAAALEGMGTLFRRGTHAMPQLVVAHLAESTTADDLRLFLRGLHRSGLPSHADVVLLFPFRPVAPEFLAVIRDEETYFQKLLVHNERDATSRKLVTSLAPTLSVFNSDAYTRIPTVAEFGTGGRRDSIWGGRPHHNDTAKPITAPDLQPAAQENSSLSTPHYGAVVGFDVQELDPDDALSGFLQSPTSMHLRRWLCYQMLLGMVRHKYRHVLLTEISGVVILSDVLSPLKKKDASQIHFFSTPQKWSDMDPKWSGDVNPIGIPIMESVYGRGVWNSLDEEEKKLKMISSGVILGGIRPVRSVAVAMATEIVRVALLQKSREPFRDACLLSYLVRKSSVLGRKVASHLRVHGAGTSNVNLLPGVSRSDDFFRNRNGHRNESSRFAVIQGLWNEGTSEERRKRIVDSLRQDICESQNDLEIYTDCYSD